MARALSDEEVRVFRELFDSYDSDKDGHITVEEFAQVLFKNPGRPYTGEEVEKVVREVDPNGDGTIDFKEFISMMTGQPYLSEREMEEQDYARAWSYYDASLNGSITPSQLRQLMAELGEVLSDGELDRLINNIDGEGKVNFRQFVRFMHRRCYWMGVVQ